MNDQNFRDLNFSLLGKSCRLTGEFEFEGETYINSYVSGKISLTDQGKLIIERDAIVEAEVYCNDIEVFGTLTGSIDANGTLSARSSAKISGKVKAKKISIFPGAEINMEGHTEETTNSPDTPPA